MSQVFEKYDYAMADKLNHFEKYVRRQSLSRFLARYELFKLILDVKGSIVECGVHHGGGLMAWAKLSSVLEPYALHRKIIGFDTFEGFPHISSNDKGSCKNKHLKEGGFETTYPVYDELVEAIKEYDENRFLNQYNKVELVKGDAVETIPDYIKSHEHTIVSLLFLDFDLYEPTKAALENLLPRIPRGGIIAFDEINNQHWPGETIALLEQFKSLNHIGIKKFSFDPNISYIIL